MTSVNLIEIPEVELAPGYMSRLVHSTFMTISNVQAKANSPLPEHSHPQEQVVNVIDGIIELTMAGTKYVLGPGSVLIIPPNVPHSAYTQTDCHIIDVFHPVRKSFPNK